MERYRRVSDRRPDAERSEGSEVTERNNWGGGGKQLGLE